MWEAFRNMVKLKINGKKYELTDDPATPLLWVLRDTLELTGTKYGCGIGQCGSCTVHVNGKPMRSCMTSLGSLHKKKITTIEGLSKDEELHPVQQAWIDEDVPQCGYCQSGQIMSATALLKKNPRPTEEEITTAMQGNLCRCGTYPRVVKAIQRVSSQSK